MLAAVANVNQLMVDRFCALLSQLLLAVVIIGGQPKMIATYSGVERFLLNCSDEEMNPRDGKWSVHTAQSPRSVLLILYILYNLFF